mmetsp:Transcript_19155/g.35324  ORF Transcript_19155/g.35324 Transcript_19155/m.35324 type:complete len:246 (-) Transcript_19155:82-819(-)
MAMDCCTKLFIALALAEMGSGHRRALGGETEERESMSMIALAGVEANGVVVNLENVSEVAPHSRPVFTDHAVTSSKQNDTRHVLVPNMSKTSPSTAGVSHSRSNIPTTSSFTEHGQGALSVLMLHRRVHSYGTLQPSLAIDFLYALMFFGLLLLGVCCCIACLVPEADVAWPEGAEQYFDEQQSEDPGDLGGTSNDPGDLGGKSDELSQGRKRDRFKTWCKSWVKGDPLLHDKETSEDQVAQKPR